MSNREEAYNTVPPLWSRQGLCAAHARRMSGVDCITRVPRPNRRSFSLPVVVKAIVESKDNWKAVSSFCEKESRRKRKRRTFTELQSKLQSRRKRKRQVRRRNTSTLIPGDGNENDAPPLTQRLRSDSFPAHYV